MVTSAVVIIIALCCCYRCERKVLNDINHATDPQQLRYHVMATHSDGTATGKVKERLTTPQEKLFVLVGRFEIVATTDYETVLCALPFVAS